MEARVCRGNVTLAPLIYLFGLPFHPLPAAWSPRELRPTHCLASTSFHSLSSCFWFLSSCSLLCVLLSSLSLRTPFVQPLLSVIVTQLRHALPFSPSGQVWIHRYIYILQNIIVKVVLTICIYTIFHTKHCTNQN